MLLAAPVFAQPLVLTPADPQPTSLTEGLSVAYVKGAGGRTLKEAKSKLKRAKTGTPLAGLSYRDTEAGESVLTSDAQEKLAATISGFIRFETAGTYDIEFFSNDGLEAYVGGQQVALADGVRGCDRTGAVTVSVPAAGWYPLEATYFQRKGSACLMMDWSVSGKLRPTPDSAFGFAGD